MTLKMLKESDCIRKETKYTKNKCRYGVYIFKCKTCPKELSYTNSCYKKASGYCRKCSDNFSLIDKLKKRICKKCKLELDIKQFITGKKSKKTCSKCWSLKKYNINYSDYLILLDKQRGVCNICKRLETRKLNNNFLSLSVDHNHKTGKIRGLLCTNCNRAIGLLHDSIKALENAIKHLKSI